jgi:hypothetical protein
LRGWDILQELIIKSIEYASKKSSRKILGITDDMIPEAIDEICVKAGKELFNYFLKYCGDPASTAHFCMNRHYKVTAKTAYELGVALSIHCQECG